LADLHEFKAPKYEIVVFGIFDRAWTCDQVLFAQAFSFESFTQPRSVLREY
jgi:hypothetical protein